MRKKESAAAELIERMERECGCRWDDYGGDNMVVAGLIGAMARKLGKNDHLPKDDVAAGVLIRYQQTQKYAEEQEARRLLADFLMAGFPPDFFLGEGKR